MIERCSGETPKETKKRFGWGWMVGLLIAGLFIGLGVWYYQTSQKKEQEHAEKLLKDENVRLEKDLSAAKLALSVCKDPASPCKRAKKPSSKTPQYRTPKVHSAKRDVVEKKPQEIRSAKLTAEQMIEACSPLPIISNGHGGWKCMPPKSVETTKEVVRVEPKPKEPDVYYPAVSVAEEESSLPTARHALGCAGVGALGGLAVEGNGRGAARGAIVALVGDVIGTMVGGSTGGTVGCGVATGGYVISRYRNRHDGNSSSPSVAPPPIVNTFPPVTGTGPGVNTLQPTSGW